MGRGRSGCSPAATCSRQHARSRPGLDAGRRPAFLSPRSFSPATRCRIAGDQGAGCGRCRGQSSPRGRAPGPGVVGGDGCRASPSRRHRCDGSTAVGHLCQQEGLRRRSTGQSTAKGGLEEWAAFSRPGRWYAPSGTPITTSQAAVSAARPCRQTGRARGLVPARTVR